MKFRSLPFTVFLAVLLFLPGRSFSQSFEETEITLSKLADDILHHPSFDHKINQNRAFTHLLMEALRDPASFAYPFDSLKTISILRADDNSFRIFTWYMVDRKTEGFRSEHYHYYFGLVQRNIKTGKGTKTVVIPLIETSHIPEGVENMLLDNRSWLGALYYQPRHKTRIPSYTVKIKNRKGGKPLNKTFYVLLGWNGADHTSNFKVVELLSFDDQDEQKVIFGADRFYFDIIPKFRALFRYSENAPFSLNYGMVKKGIGKKEMIIYDHLAPPKHANPMPGTWQMGPDGSYDGLLFYKKGGYFEWYRNIRLAEKFDNKYSRKEAAAQAKAEKKRLKEAGIDPQD